ncbi:MAG TPA: acyltransferase, partial [Ohtaekwangia sp.]
MTTNRFFVPGLDGLRFVSFLLIFIHHSEDTPMSFVNNMKEHGWIGVDIFFSLSAYLLTRLLRIELDQTGEIIFRKFFMRRVLRIWPLFFTYLTGIILITAFTQQVTSENGFRIVSLFTFTDNFFTAVYGFNPIQFTGHLWTIAYEEQFYLLLPFIMLFIYRMSAGKKVVFLASIVLTGFLIRFLFIFYGVKHPAIWVLPITHFESIITGMVLGLSDLRSLEKKRIPILIITVLAGCLILFLPGTGVISYHLMILYPCIGIFSGGVVALSITAKDTFIKGIFTSPLLSYLGKISFGLYVFHGVCLVATGYVLRHFSIDHSLLTT